jgi:Sec-independent protein secretion pathway component TatC
MTRPIPLIFLLRCTVTSQEPFEKQALTEHLAELRSCLIISFIALGVGFALVYSVIKPVAAWFIRPLVQALPEHKNLIFTAYQEGFFFI